jgi:hypothetical protein
MALSDRLGRNFSILYDGRHASSLPRVQQAFPQRPLFLRGVFTFVNEKINQISSQFGFDPFE